jgi:hypothetical protein
MLIFDRLLVGGIRFVLDKIVAAAESELDDAEALKRRLLEAQMRLELGEIDEAAFASTEKEILRRLHQLREAREAADAQDGEGHDGGRLRVDAIEADWEEVPPPRRSPSRSRRPARPGAPSRRS